MTTTPFGFRVLGSKDELRRLIDWLAAIRAYAACDPKAEVEREAYLSAFTFGADFREYLAATISTAGFAGVCGASWIWLDIDRDDADAALRDTRKLIGALTALDGVTDDELLAFYSGSKGFHVGVAASLWSPSPSRTFNAAARHFAERIAAHAGVAIDTGVYDKVRLFRAPNSRHPKTGLHKRRFGVDELLHLSPERIRQLAVTPDAFELPTPSGRSAAAGQLWAEAVKLAESDAAAKLERRAANASGNAKLNRATIDFIRDAAGIGDRHRLLFSAAANLAELGCGFELAYELLAPVSLDAGLPPREVERQIRCGLAHVAGGAL